MDNWTVETVNWAQESSLSLLVFFAEKTLSFSTYSKNQRSFLSHHSFPLLQSKSIAESCNQAYLKLPYQRADFLETKVGFYSPFVTLFPAAIDNESIQKIFAFEHGITEEACKMMRIKSSNLGKLAFILPEEASAWALQKFNAPEFYPSRELSLNFAMQVKSKDMLLLIIQDDAIELIVKTKGVLQFHNHFKVNTTEDILYYSLYALDQLGINKDSISAYIAGNINAPEIDLAEIKRFLNIKIAPQEHDFGCPKELNANYFSSFQLLLCE